MNTVNDVEIAPFTIIHENVTLENQVKIGAYCELGISTPLGDSTPLIIGEDSLIRSHSAFYESSSFGPRLTTGHHVNVRENTIAGANFQIGTLSEIQGDCSAGDYVRFQSNVFVGKKTTIGNFVGTLPYLVLTYDPTPPSNVLMGCTIEDYASIATASVALPGATTGHHSLVAAQACVTKNAPQTWSLPVYPHMSLATPKQSSYAMTPTGRRIHGHITLHEDIPHQ